MTTDVESIKAPPEAEVGYRSVTSSKTTVVLRGSGRSSHSHNARRRRDGEWDTRRRALDDPRVGEASRRMARDVDAAAAPERDRVRHGNRYTVGHDVTASAA